MRQTCCVALSVTEERDRAVDFSDSYYDVNQALVAKKGSPIAEAASLSDLAAYKLGAQVGTTSYSYITQFIQPEDEPFTYDTTNDAKSALNAGQIDGIVATMVRAVGALGLEASGVEVVLGVGQKRLLGDRPVETREPLRQRISAGGGRVAVRQPRNRGHPAGAHSVQTGTGHLHPAAVSQ